MLSGKAAIHTQDSLAPEPAFLTAAIFLFSFPAPQSAGRSWLHFEVSDSAVGLWNTVSIDRRVATQWPPLTAALFSSQPMTDVLPAALRLVSKWMPVMNAAERLNSCQLMHVEEF